MCVVLGSGITIPGYAPAPCHIAGIFRPLAESKHLKGVTLPANLFLPASGILPGAPERIVAREEHREHEPPASVRGVGGARDRRLPSEAQLTLGSKTLA